MGVMTIQTFGPWVYGQDWVVAKILSPASSIQEKIDEIVDATANKRYRIEVLSGIYEEAVTMKAFIDVVCPYGEACIKPPAASSFAVTMATNSMLQGFKVDMSEGATTGIVIGALTLAKVENCWITGGAAGDIGISDASAGTSVIITGCTIDGSATGYQKTAAGTTWLGECQITSVTDGIDVDVNLGTLNIYECELMGIGTGANIDVAAAVITINSADNQLNGDGWQLASNASVLVISTNDNFAKVTFAGALGEFVDLTDCKLYTCGAGVIVREWVYISGADTVTEAKADVLATMPCVGVVVYKPSGTTCFVKQAGYVWDASGPWAAVGDEYYVSDATAGAITSTMPGVWPQRVGVATSTQRMKILIGDNLGLVHTNVYLNVGGAVAVNDWVYITATNDTVAKAKSDVAATMPAIGVVVEVIDVTTCRVKGDGKFSRTTLGYTASDDVYISAGTAGAITNVIPVMAIIQKVAEVKSDVGGVLTLELS